ncbi:MAG TPA: SET domain-containing protein-lysine N-methyltransferase [Chloroflexota bacterium]|nr:SET domain-containing protein-lysine N-methyltransferase [Chloroflexota bacterium]
MNVSRPSRRPRSTPLIEVRPSPIHGWGGFARQDIPAGTRLIEYTGQRISPEEGARRYPDTGRRSHTFFFSLSNGRYIDPEVRGNLARFLNHACTPNCRAVEEGGRIFIETLKRVAAGTELTYDYKLTLPANWKRASVQRRYTCDCGSRRCRRTLLDL